MEHAATLIGHRHAVLPLIVSARLRQGSSTRSSWILEDAPGGTTITVGADAACDWQVRAAFVPPCAFSLRLLEGILMVRAAYEPGVLLNGRPVGVAWTPVPSGARLDVGLARIEVTLQDPLAREALQAEDSGVRPVAHPGAPHVAPGAVFDLLPQAGGVTARLGPPPSSPSWRGRTSRPPRSAVATLDALTNTARFERTAREALPEESFVGDVTPALLDDARTDKPSLLRYALAFAVTACAYGGWVALLDYL